MARNNFENTALAGITLSGEVVIDAHMHIDMYNKFFIPAAATEHLIANARRIGIQKLYGSSLLAIRNDAQTGNANVMRTHHKYPEIFEPYLVIKPNYPEEITSIIEFSITNSINQFKLHDDGNDYLYDHKNYFPLYEHCNNHNSIILFHTYGNLHLRPITNIAKQFKSIKILLAHSGIIDEQSYIDIANSYENVFLETCNSWAWYGLIERLVNAVGSYKILFGTDMPFMSPDQQIGRILFAKISDNDKRNILGINAQTLFNLK
ncbi:MAG: amidohydrolase family protein [Bacteroidetes bacterium]|nr:amidohydrolase family protein [Bacteroidota bacterium]